MDYEIPEVNSKKYFDYIEEALPRIIAQDVEEFTEEAEKELSHVKSWFGIVNDSKLEDLLEDSKVETYKQQNSNGFAEIDFEKIILITKKLQEDFTITHSRTQQDKELFMATLESLNASLDAYKAAVEAKMTDDDVALAAAKATISKDEGVIATDNQQITDLQGHAVPDELIAKLDAATATLGGTSPAVVVPVVPEGSANQPVTVVQANPSSASAEGGITNPATEVSPKTLPTSEITAANLATANPGDSSNLSNINSTPVADAKTETSAPSASDLAPAQVAPNAPEIIPAVEATKSA